GEAIVRSMPHGRGSSWPMVVRTCVMDEIILRAVETDGVKTVINLAAGLDTRPFRLPLPATLRWIEVDLPEILAYKRKVLEGETPSCRYETEAVDLLDANGRREFFSRVGAGGEPTLVVTEGLLVYLEDTAVRELATDLHSQPGFRWWLIDIASPRILEMLRK